MAAKGTPAAAFGAQGLHQHDDSHPYPVQAALRVWRTAVNLPPGERTISPARAWQAVLEAAPLDPDFFVVGTKLYRWDGPAYKSRARSGAPLVRQAHRYNKLQQGWNRTADRFAEHTKRGA